MIIELQVLNENKEVTRKLNVSERNIDDIEWICEAVGSLVGSENVRIKRYVN